MLLQSKMSWGGGVRKGESELVNNRDGTGDECAWETKVLKMGR